MVKKRHSNSWYYFINVIVPVLFYSGVAGVVTGAVVCLYNYGASKLSHFSLTIYSFTRQNLWYIPLLFIGLIISALIIYFIQKKVPESKGSGVPRTEGVLRGLLTFRWLRLIISSVVCSFVSFLCGLSVGAEGPSIQLGATTSQGVSMALKTKLAWRRYVLTGGAGAGLASAFNAPLTGILFTMEEVHKRFTPMILMSTASSVMFATLTMRLISSLWGGSGAFFYMGEITAIPVKSFYLMIILGVACGLFATFFNFMIRVSSSKLSKIKKLPDWVKLVFAFVVTGAVSLLWVDTIGSGHDLIIDIAEGNYKITILIILLFVKLFLILTCFNSGTTGGLFVPMLSIGALVGGIVGSILIKIGVMDAVYLKAFIVIGMTSFMGASVRAPLMSIILIVEITDQLSGFMSTGFAIFTAFFVSELFDSSPLYESLLEKILHKEYHSEEIKIYHFKGIVDVGSFAVHKSVSDILWPANCLVTELARKNETTIVPDGETVLQIGDELNLQAETKDSLQTKKLLEDILGVVIIVDDIVAEKDVEADVCA